MTITVFTLGTRCITLLGATIALFIARGTLIASVIGLGATSSLAARIIAFVVTLGFTLAATGIISVLGFGLTRRGRGAGRRGGR